MLSNGNGDAELTTMLKRFFSTACDDVVRPRSFPEGALDKVIHYGGCLETLELDMYIMSVGELRSLLASCKKLRYLRFLLDAPLAKVVSEIAVRVV